MNSKYNGVTLMQNASPNELHHYNFKTSTFRCICL